MFFGGRGISFREIGVGGHHVHTATGQGQVCGRCDGDKCLSFTGLHLGDMPTGQLDYRQQLKIIQLDSVAASHGLGRQSYSRDKQFRRIMVSFR